MSNFWLALDELQKEIEAKVEEKIDEACQENGGALMGANTRFLNEAKELEARWAKSGLLDGLDDRYCRATTAVLLESQRLMNEQPKQSEPPWTNLKQRYEDAVRELYEDEEEDEVTLFLKECKKRAEARKYRCQITG